MQNGGLGQGGWSANGSGTSANPQGFMDPAANIFQWKPDNCEPSDSPAWLGPERSRALSAQPEIGKQH